ncbi:hypothetical protein [Robiginitalea sp. SC105]|uniref:hypothetical protein n=1 Tax=Robiginitalea sp. SC105 TaxID=2762332 RepID=UPI0016399628|nr:hypothetical protein [Robiginitalea sp. SC105]MBC2839357.1 hypothetical protein [Robiginitalea sp. SC105]
MSRKLVSTLSVFLLLLPFRGISQGESTDSLQAGADRLFASSEPLPITIRASIETLKRDTNDSTYLDGMMYYQWPGEPDSLALRLQARGNFRRTECYFAPLKLTFRKKDARPTIFRDQRELKLVLPCLIGSEGDDLVLKEYLAYRFFERLAPYYYRTRLVQVTFIELKGRRERTHELLGFLIEDHGTLARRYGGKRIRRDMPPQMQDDRLTALNNLFQFLIGHTDFSIRKQHNQRLYYIDETYVSIPYDFDMSGFVNAPYATVSNTQHLKGNITDVRQRIYKGYQRPDAVLQEVRSDILESRADIFDIMASVKPLFKDVRQLRVAEEYIGEGFNILEDDRHFQRRILEALRE